MSENNTGNPFFVLGQEFLLDFTQLLSKEIEQFLIEKWGEEWFELCVVKESHITVEAMSDLSFLLRQTLDLNNHNFRVALAMSFFGKTQIEKPHLTALEIIRKSRNFWAHPNRLIKIYDLNKLAFNILAIIPISEPLYKKCAQLLSTEVRNDHLSVIASMTEINRKYKNTAEYRTQFAKSLDEFAKHVKAISSQENLHPLFTAQNHMLRNLWGNFLIIQPMYYALQLDCLIEQRDPQSGFKTFSDEYLLELQRDLDVEGGLRIAQEYLDSMKSEIGSDKCECEYCQSIASTGPIFFREDSQKIVDDLHVAVHKDGDLSTLFEGRNLGGRRPEYFWYLTVMSTLIGNISAEDVVKWNFDILNPSLTRNSEAFEDDDVMLATLKLLAIRNGVAPSVVDKWEFHD